MLAATVVAALGLVAMALPAVEAAAAPSTETVIVALREGSEPAAVVAARLAALHGGEVGHVYGAALRGFSARVPSHAVAALERNPLVVRVEPDTVHSIQQQIVPTGIDRSEVDRNPTVSTDGTGVTVDADVAIIDTGILAAHPDLNVAGGYNATLIPLGWGDDNGHGTHVAGTVAARDDGQGVVGVAPGARVWAVKVCNVLGFCLASDIIAGIDWVAQRKSSGAIDFVAANFSISSADSNNSCASPADSTHQAICGLVGSGVSFVMAAGNDNRLKVPYPVAFSVSAVADFDGRSGGLGSQTCRADTDDTLADFSNYGSGVDIAAPGVCILSAWNDGGYSTISGTSMATPHVTGAVALYVHANGLSPAQSAGGVAAIENAIVGAAHPQGTSNHSCSYDDSRTGGPMLFVNHADFGGDGTCQ
jgi:subtilisin family serine protease